MIFENKHFVKRGVMGLSIACASLIMLGTSQVQAKGPVPAATVKTEMKKTSLTEERINAVLKEAYEKFKNDQGGKNADYIKAKEDQAFIEGRIQELEETLKHAKVIKPGENEPGIVKIGSKVTVKEEGCPVETFYIVGSKEADPQNGKISYESPIGKNLLNHHKGDIVRVETPGGFTNFKIIEIK